MHAGGDDDDDDDTLKMDIQTPSSDACQGDGGGGGGGDDGDDDGHAVRPPGFLHIHSTLPKTLSYSSHHNLGENVVLEELHIELESPLSLLQLVILQEKRYKE